MPDSKLNHHPAPPQKKLLMCFPESSGTASGLQGKGEGVIHSTEHHGTSLPMPISKKKTFKKEPIQLNTELAQTSAAAGSGMGQSHWKRAVFHL